VLKLSKFLGLDEGQTLDLFKQYLMNEYRGSRSQLQAVISNERYGDALMVKIMGYYFEERLTVYRCLKHLFIFWQDTRHPYRMEYKKFVESHLVDKEQQFVKQLMTQNKASCSRRAPTSANHGEAMTSHLSSCWAMQLLKEQASVMEVLLLYYRDFQMPSESLIDFAKVFQAQLFGARQLNKYLFDGSANELIDYIGALQMLVVIEGLDIDWILGSLQPNSLAQHHIVQFGDCCQELDQLFSSWGDLANHGPILLSWAILRLLTGDSLAAKVSKKIGGQALQNGALQQLLATLQLNHVKADSAICVTVKSVIHILVSVIVSTFDESALGDSADLIAVLTETLAAKHICKSFWKRVGNM
jgi:nuclear pore complex protein Nup188